MASQKEDTDPSTPASRRSQSSPAGQPASRKGASREPENAKGIRPTTERGLGGPDSGSGSSGPQSFGRPMGVVVPPPSGRGPNAVTPVGVATLSASAALAASATRPKDSVELLLEGMAGPRPDRTKTTPQSAGEASAAYHAKHGVHPAQTLSEPGPTVVVERERPSSAPPEPKAAPVVKPSQDSVSTEIPPRPLSRRVAMAVLAALLIVLASFVVLDLSSNRQGTGVPSAAEKVAPLASVAAPVPAVPVTAAAAPPSPGPSPVAIEGTASASAPEVAPPAPSVQAKDAVGPMKRRHRVGTGAPGDLGEFKASF